MIVTLWRTLSLHLKCMSKSNELLSQSLSYKGLNCNKSSQSFFGTKWNYIVAKASRNKFKPETKVNWNRSLSKH